MSLNPRAADALAAKLLALAAAPPSARVLEPIAKEAVAKGVHAALARRQQVRGSVSTAQHAVRLSFRGPGSLAAQRAAMAHLDGRLWAAMNDVYAQTVKGMGGRVR